MEDTSDRTERASRRRKLVAGSLIFALSFLLFICSPAIYNLFNPLPFPDDPPSHKFTVWISPVEEEVFLSVDFYSTEQGTVEQENNLAGFTKRINPSEYEQSKSFAFNLPRNLLVVWVRIYFNESPQTNFGIHSIGIGQMKTTEILDFTISIFLEPNQ